MALVVNPRSGGATPPAEVERLLRAAGAADVVRFGPDDAEAAAAAGDRVVVAGGDGTLGPVAAAAAARGVPLAVVPAGTANDFARRMGLPLAAAEACRLAVTGGLLRPVDLARAGGRPFLNVASAGLAVRAAREAGRLKEALGSLAYAVGAARAAAAGRPLRCRVATADGPLFDGAAWQVIVANTGAFGGGSTVEVADPADRRLDVAVLPAGPRLRLVRYAYGLRLGSIAAQPDVRHAAAPRVDVDVPAGTRFNVDGEVVRLGPCAFTLAAAAVRLVVP